MLLPTLCFLLICLIFLVIYASTKTINTSFFQKKKPHTVEAQTTKLVEQHKKSAYYLIKAKPEWVINEVIKLKALIPRHGCRKIASTFNRIHAGSGHTISKSYVAYTVRNHLYEVLKLRKRFKHNIPRPLPKNKIWGMDLTFITDQSGKQNTILGIIDHGSRANLLLKRMDNKASVAILRMLADTIERFGKPQAIRTDNEVVFCSKLMMFVLVLLGVKHQRSEPGCPWQNGRIERLFLTLKQTIPLESMLKTRDEVDICLQHFRLWYNHIRPHQHLSGITPAEAWSGKAANKKGIAYYFNVGPLQGFYIPPD